MSNYVGTGVVIHIPAGACPVPLKGADAESIYSWADRVREHYETLGNRITPRGLLYHARDFYTYGTSEYEAVREILLADEEEV